ncbi:MAG TPA: FkbM family methyltransferase [Elusimicrobiota bacterium]|nr:FkbM family methyltransferase [Elusimicrobiota bacterium]
MNIDSPPYRLAQRLWLALRRTLETMVPRNQLDRWLDKAGFFTFKAGHFRRLRALPGGSLIAYRPDDEKIINEIHGCANPGGQYSRGAIADGDVVFDVGAHIGVFSVYAARKNPHGRIIAVEPAPFNLELLRENIARNGLRNVKIYPCAVSDHSGEARLFSFGDHALYSLESPAPGLLSTPARLRTLDDIFEAEGLAVCHLLKVDIEKSELPALKGGRRMLAATRQVILEASKENGIHEQAASFLRSLGFTCSTEFDSPEAEIIYAHR